MSPALRSPRSPRRRPECTRTTMHARAVCRARCLSQLLFAFVCLSHRPDDASCLGWAHGIATLVAFTLRYGSQLPPLICLRSRTHTHTHTAGIRVRGWRSCERKWPRSPTVYLVIQIPALGWQGWRGLPPARTMRCRNSLLKFEPNFQYTSYPSVVNQHSPLSQ